MAELTEPLARLGDDDANHLILLLYGFSPVSNSGSPAL